MEFIANLGHTINRKEIVIEELSKGGYVILGTPKLTFKELNEVVGVCIHQIEYNAKQKAAGL